MEKRTGGVRSRLGCLTCRRRHKKCDEEKPVCNVCRVGKRECAYGSDLKWTAVGHTASFASMYGKGSKGSFRKAKSSVSHDTPSDLSGGPAGLQTPDNPDSDSGPDLLSSTWNSLPVVLPYGSINGGDITSSFVHFTEADQIQHHIPIAFSHSSAGEAWEEMPPRSDELYPHQVESDPIFDSNDYLEEPVEEIICPLISTDSGLSQSELEIQTMNNDLAAGLSTTFVAPGDELAYTYYIHQASSRIPAHDSLQNPYRKLCVVALSYPVLLQAIIYVSAVSMVNFGSSDYGLVPRRRAQALCSLQNAFTYLKSRKTSQDRDSSITSPCNQAVSVLTVKEIALAALLMHIASEVMSGSEGAESYLQSAFDLIVDLGYIQRMPSSFFSRFLTQRFAIIDVVLSLLRRRKPIAPLDFVLYQESEEVDYCEPSFREMTGCSQHVLTFLARVSYLAEERSMLSRGKNLILADAYQLEAEMQTYGKNYLATLHESAAQLDSGNGVPLSIDGRQNLDILTECFFWTAQLLLMRRVFLDLVTSPRVQFIRRHLFSLMNRLPAGCGPDSSLPFPFYIAAREAMTQSDRDWVRQKHREMMNVYRDKSREIMMALTEEIWQRLDLSAANTNPIEPWCSSVDNAKGDSDSHFLDITASHFIF